MTRTVLLVLVCAAAVAADGASWRDFTVDSFSHDIAVRKFMTRWSEADEVDAAGGGGDDGADAADEGPKVPVTVEVVTTEVLPSTHYSTYTMATASWVCAPYDEASPWEAHNLLIDYRRGNNEAGADMMHILSWPLMLIEMPTGRQLCYYLDSAVNCYPPVPLENDLRTLDTAEEQYYAKRFWGQATGARVASISTKVKTHLAGVADADLDTMFLSYMPGHIKEIRYNKK